MNHPNQSNHQARNCAVIAFRMARRYGSRIPLPAELIRDFKLARPTAYRYLAAMREAAKVTP